jgi:hypothetical protein
VRVADVAPEAPTRTPEAARPERGRTATRVVGSATFVLVATALQPLRQSGMPMWRTVWAEDAAVFYETAREQPLHEVLFESYAGYAHAVPRILAAVGAQLPAERYSQFVTFSASFLVALLALFVYWASAPLLRSPVRQGVLAGAMVLLPILPYEVIGAICNIHWFVPLACLLAVLIPVTRPAAIGVRLVIVVLAALSSPLSVLFAPIAIWHVVRHLLRRTDVRTLVVPVGLLLASALQMLIWWNARTPSPERPSTVEMADYIARLYGTKVTLNTFFGVRGMEWLWERTGYGLAVATMAVLVGVIVWKVTRASPTSRALILSAVAVSVATYAFSMYQRPELIDVVLVEPGEVYNFLAMRYEILPALLLLAALLLPVDLERGALLHPTVAPVAPAPVLLRRDRIVVAAAALWFAVALVPSFHFANGRSEGPNWPAQVHGAREACAIESEVEAEPDSPAGEPALEELVISVSPAAPGWEIVLTCEEVAAPATGSTAADDSLGPAGDR